MEADLKIALRDSASATRPYVLVNPLQAKHLPSVPSVTLEYFARLGRKVADTCEGEKVLTIGFAETATAVGAVVASAVGNSVYAHTTREPLPAVSSRSGEPLRLAAEFFEEHSHAKNQALYLRESFSDLSVYDRIVFVEDEITTGKTILNFLRNVDYGGNITVSALVFNGFDKSAFSSYRAEFVCLQEVPDNWDYRRFEAREFGAGPDPAGKPSPMELVPCFFDRLEFGALPDPRSGVESGAYRRECAELASQIAAALGEHDVRDKDILVVGTEEFMYPALALGYELEKNARSVKSQSTTRSPLLPLRAEGYPIHTRLEFASLYDHGRTTYLYNMEKYDTVIIFTDARSSPSDELAGALLGCGNTKIYFVSFVRPRNAD